MPEPSSQTPITLPRKAKPSKLASRDPARPVLGHAHVYQRNGHREIAVTDSYSLVTLPVGDDVPLGAVNVEALKRIEAGEKHTITGAGVEVTAKRTGQPVIYPAPKVGESPDFTKLFDDEPRADEPGVIQIGLDPRLLMNVAEALGVPASYGVVLTIRVKDGTTLQAMHVRPDKELVSSDTGDALLMPMRVSP